MYAHRWCPLPKTSIVARKRVKWFVPTLPRPLTTSTNQRPLGAVPPFLENHPSRVSEGVESASSFQRNLVYDSSSYQWRPFNEHFHIVEPGLSRHHGTYGTILIAPSLNSSMRIRGALVNDNARRREAIERGEPDPGRNEDTDWTKARVRFHYFLSTQ